MKHTKMKQIVFLLICLVVNELNAQPIPVYKNPSSPAHERVKDLLKRMTVREKVNQISADVLKKKHIDSTFQFIPDSQMAGLLKNGLGQLGKPCVAFDLGPKETAIVTNRIQKSIIEGNRLGIPVIFHEEALHGLWARDATVYPQAIGMSCTWEPKLIQKIFSEIALETRTRGSHQVNTPMLDVCRDPRWGRIEESYGEDPYLTSRFAEAIVTGLQGDKEHVAENKIDKHHVIATVKHFAGYGVSERGLNKGPVVYGERLFREAILPPFKAAVENAGALSVMPGYHAVDGVPCHGNKWLLTSVLRNEWNFQGYVVSDYGGIDDLRNLHRVAGSLLEAAQLALLSGVDLELASPHCNVLLEEVCKNDPILASALDTAVSRVLRMKFLLGLFDDPYTDPDEAVRMSHTKKQKHLALEAAEKSIVLLKNENGFLPLDKSNIKRIAVIGPNANECRYGGYSHRDEERGISILEGIQNKVGKDIEIKYAEGCKIHENRGYWLDFKVEPVDEKQDRQRIKKAVQIAKKADVVILVLGGTAMTCGEFLGYRHSLDLFGRQNDLFDTIVRTGVPVVVCLINGRPLTINTIDKNANSILECWYAGETTGTAVANILFGDVNPSGKLTLTFPRTTGHLPHYYNLYPGGRHQYLATDNTPLYPFGYGLSYTTYTYSHLIVTPSKIKFGENVTIKIDVKNTGQYAGEEIVQLYIRDEYCSVARPVKELKGFKKVKLNPGESKTVTFVIRPDDLKFYNPEYKFVLEPGEFKGMAGPNSVDLMEGTFYIIQ
jgi:beta-glucosidase